MYGKETGDKTKDAKITPAGSIPQAGNDSSGGYLQKNKAVSQSDVNKINRTKIKK